MSLNDTLMQDMKTAMKAKDKEALTTIRSLKAAVMNYKIKVGHDLTSDDELILRGNLSSKLFSKLVNDPSYIPSKNVVFSFLPHSRSYMGDSIG